jgi:hypothetical protein
VINNLIFFRVCDNSSAVFFVRGSLMKTPGLNKFKEGGKRV